MKIVNTLTNTQPLFAHAQGLSFTRPAWKQIAALNIRRPVKFLNHNDITIVTFATPGLNNTLIPQLLASEIPFVNLAVNHTGPWNNTLKIIYFYEFLKTVKTPYILSLDSIDILLAEDLSNLLPIFLQQNCNILYGSTINNYPPDINDTPVGATPWKYLNAGTLIGRPETLLDFYSIMINDLDKDYGLYNKSEQCRIKHARDSYSGEIKIDNNCELFQTFDGIKFVYKRNTLFATGLRCGKPHE